MLTLTGCNNAKAFPGGGHVQDPAVQAQMAEARSAEARRDFTGALAAYRKAWEASGEKDGDAALGIAATVGPAYGIPLNDQVSALVSTAAVTPPLSGWSPTPAELSRTREALAIAVPPCRAVADGRAEVIEGHVAADDPGFLAALAAREFIRAAASTREITPSALALDAAIHDLTQSEAHCVRALRKMPADRSAGVRRLETAAADRRRELRGQRLSLKGA
mgnify:CR=1 FL=1